MNKLLFLFISTSIFNCEKPAPQKPKVISSSIYHDSIAMAVSHLDTTSHLIDSTQNDLADQTNSLELDDNYVTYTNAADRIVHIAYEQMGSNRQIKLIFPEQNIHTTLPESNSGSNTYIKDQIKWETNNTHTIGKLTIFGTWFEFILKE